MLTITSNNTEQEEAVSNPLNKNKHKIQPKIINKTTPLQISATKEAKSSAVDDLLTKLQPYNLTASDAATAAKYYYNQHDLQLLNTDQLASLHKRLVARAEAETSPPNALEPAPLNPSVLTPVTTFVSVNEEQEITAPVSITSEEQNMSAIEQLSPIATNSLTSATEPTPAVAELAAPAVEPIIEAVEATSLALEVAAPELVAPEPAPTETAIGEPLFVDTASVESVLVASIEPEPVILASVVAPEFAIVEAVLVVAEEKPEPLVVAVPVVSVVLAPIEIASVVAPMVTVAEEAPEPEPEVKEPEPTPEPEIMEPRYWKKNGWSAKVIKNEDDDGWAVEICKDGLSDPVLVSPWVMGRDKKNPKPFDSPSFTTFVKTASEIMRRAAQQRERQLKKSVSCCWDGIWFKIVLEITPDEYDPYATLSATNDEGEVVAKIRVAPNYKFSQAVADKWVRGGFKE
jgi:hypothetical protein